VDLSTIVGALMRARQLVGDLDNSDRPVDRHQVAAGVRHELDTALRGLSERLERERAAVGAPGPGLIRKDARATSRTAGEGVAPRRGTQAWKVLCALAGHPGGRTDLEIQFDTGIPANTERPRRKELADDGFVRATTRTREHNGTEWTVWELTTRGWDMAEELGYRRPPRTEEQQPSLFEP
jgi:hypothetical protein